ncbi:hypothetical protein ACU8V7_15945 [Zobellia nedashkovskayae]
MSEYLKSLLDERNTELWNTLNSSQNIVLESSFEPNYITNFKEGKITIYIDDKSLNPADFTHELLHIKLKSNGLNIGKYLSDKIAENENLYYLFSKDLIDHIGNCLEHVKMLPIFIDLGFKNNQFLSDYNTKKMSSGQLKEIKVRYREGGIYDREVIDSFIGSFISMKADNNRMNKYNDLYKSCAKLDKKLFKTLVDFWEDWISFNYNDPNDKYDDIVQYFVEDLNDWIENKTVI